MNILFTYIKAIVLACLLISGASAANAAEHDLSAEEATKLFSGKTVKAYYIGLGYWFTAYFDPIGRIHETDDIGGDRQGQWRIDKRGRKCVQWIVGQEFCNIIVSDGKEYREIMTRKGGAEHIATFVKFTEGNPDNL
jgi:hypothetical protein